MCAMEYPSLARGLLLSVSSLSLVYKALARIYQEANEAISLYIETK